ncbi:hypothetical protein GCM10027447_01850 [Glycomyces halotolerans]
MPGDSRSYLAASENGGMNAWSSEAASEGRRGTQRLLEVAKVRAPDEIAKMLDLAFGNHVVLRKRLILLDDAPVEIATSYYPASIAGDTALALEKKVKGGAPAVLAELGFAPATAAEVVQTRRPTWDEAKQLRLHNEWVLVLERTVYSKDETPVEAAINVMAPSRSVGYTVGVS